MAILAALQSASIRLIGRKPATFFGSSNQFEIELCDLVNEAAQDVAKYQDWQALVRIATINGDGVTKLFDLPADYDRMGLVSDVQDQTNWVFGYYPFSDINTYLFQEARGFTPLPGGWIIYGSEMRFSPAPATSVAQFPYVSKNWARPQSGADTAAFTLDTDSFLLPERLLTLGLVWRWRENKKLDFTGDMEAFSKALDEYASKDRGSRVIRSRASRSFARTPIAYPYELG